jgi:hypothetical protein
MTTQVYGNNIFRTTIICVDEYVNKIPVGRIYNAYYEDGVAFHGVIELLLIIDRMLEDMNWPQAYSGYRSFRASDEIHAPAKTAIDKKEGKQGTFSLRILFRQNASWQGSVTWHEGGQEESFRSVFELLLLINSALESEKE